MPPLLEVDQLSVAYGRVQAVRAVSLQIDEGGVIESHQRRHDEDDDPLLRRKSVDPKAEIRRTKMMARVMCKAVETKFPG